MKRIARVVLLASIAAPALHAQTTRPDFSGTWIMDMTRSASAVQNDPIPQTTLVINQTATQLSIETQRAGKTSTITYRPGSADAIANATINSTRLMPAVNSSGKISRVQNDNPCAACDAATSPRAN